jgi:hypothetical protein
VNRAEFAEQINRLAKTFGPTQYGEERLSILWTEIGALPVEWLKTTVSEFIANERYAPTIAQFREPAGKERERQWNASKRQERVSLEAWQNAFTEEDKKMFCEAIVGRMQGVLPDDKWRGFLRLLDAMPKGPKRCEHCDNTGLKFVRTEVAEFLFRCRCERGRQDNRPYPMWSGL